MSGAARQASHTVLTSAAKFALGAVSTIVVARELGPERRGAYAVLVTISTVAMIMGNLSIESAQTSLWSRTAGRGAVAANALVLGLGVGGICAVGTAVITALDPAVLPVPDYGLLLVALLAIPCNMSATLLNNVLTLSGQIKVVNWGGLLSVCVYCGILVLLTMSGRLTLGWVIVMWTASAAIPSVVAGCVVRPRLRDRDRALARRALGMGLRYHPGYVSRYLLLRIDVLILNVLTSRTAVGLYAVAVMLMDLTRTAADSIAQVTLQQQMDGDHDSAVDLTLRTTRLATILVTGSVGLMCAAAPVLIPVVYGPAFTGSIAPLLALAPGLVALGATRTVGSFLLRLNRPLTTSGIALGTLAANVALNVLLIPVWGITGCALISSVSYCALAALQLTWFARVARVPYRRFVPGPADVRYLVTASARLAVTLAGIPRRTRTRGEDDGVYTGPIGGPPG